MTSANRLTPKQMTGRIYRLEQSLSFMVERQSALNSYLWRGSILALLAATLAGVAGVSYGRKQTEIVQPPVPVAASATQPFTITDASLQKTYALAKADNPEALTRFASALIAGQGVERKPGEAVTFLKKAAEHDYVPAMLLLAQGHSKGLFDTPRDIYAALRWYETAAVAGSMDAALVLGRAYEKGIDGAPDTGLAIGWYQRAAALGSQVAMESLARLAPKQPPITAEDIKTLQTTLNELGFKAGRPSGKLTRQTQEAIRQYQAQNGLMVDGRAGHALIARLEEESIAQGDRN